MLANLPKKPKWPNLGIHVLLKTKHLQAEKEGGIAYFRVFRQILCNPKHFAPP